MDYIRLRDICDVRDGTHDSPSFIAKGFPLVTSKNIVNGRLDLTTVSYISKEDYDKINERSKVDPGDIIMPMIGTIGNPLIVGDNCEFAIKNVALIKFPSKEISNRFVWHYLKSPCFKRAIDRVNRGGTQKFVSLGNVRDLQVPQYECSDQLKIVRRLDKLLSIIETTKLLLAKLDELVKARFVEMFGDPLLGTQKWDIQFVGDVADAIDPQPSHRTPAIVDDGVPYVSIKDCNYTTGTIDFDGARRVGRDVLDDHRNRYTINDGDMIIGKIGTIGNPVFVPVRDDYTLSANVVLIQPRINKVSPYFLKFSLMSSFADQQFEEAKNSTSQAAFGIQKVRNIRIMNPDVNVQYSFEAFAKQIDKSKAEVQKALEKTQLLFDSLMQEYFG